MIEGLVNSRHEAIVTLRLHGPQGAAREIEAVIDTGYNGFLALPKALALELELHFLGTGQAFWANDEEVEFDTHAVTVLWDGQERQVRAAAAGSTPLIGMLLLDGHYLNIEVEIGGRVNIRARQ